MITELTKGVYWVGVVDWGLRRFHGHELSTHRGSTYNAYLIVDEKIALVDTVWGPFQDQLIANIREVVDPAKIDFVIANHAEVDHAGSLPAVMRAAPQATVVVSKRGRESVEGHFHQPWSFKAVQTGDKISLGSCELVFIEAPMLHWPDSMFTYVAGKGILMPNDAFGQHYATAFRFNDQVDQEELYEEALKYYANILTPFSDLVTKKITEVLALNLPVEIIAPSHGVIWRRSPASIVEAYRRWASGEAKERVVIAYETMWGSTEKMARALAEGVADEGVEALLRGLPMADRTDVVKELLEAKGLLMGSSTHNQHMLLNIAALVEDLKGLRFTRKIGAAFGSYGWAGTAVGHLEESLREAGFDVIVSDLAFRWAPSAADLERAREFGRRFAREVRQALSQPVAAHHGPEA